MHKIISLLALLWTTLSHADGLEVLHWWTAPGEFQAKQGLQLALAKRGVSWQDFAIDGAGGASAQRVLQMRALSGNPPDVAQIKGPDIAEWSRIGMLTALDSIINDDAWDAHIPKTVKQAVRYQDRYMALPINIHRVNWLWLNKAISDELNLSPPTTWHVFFSNADKIKKAGYVALAHGGSSWQDSLLFEAVALSVLGAANYQRAFVAFDEGVLTSAQMVTAFKLFKKLNQYIDGNLRGKDWTVSSQMLSDKKAGMLIMGDWAKGLWQAQGKVAMRDYLCVDLPESSDLFSYNIDSFVFFKKTPQRKGNVNLQVFAETLLSNQFQYAFNRQKGSLPVRNNMDMSAFDLCTQKAYRDFNRAQLVPSFSQSMATSSYLQSEISKIISDYFNSDSLTAEQATKQLALAIRAVNKK